MISLVSIIIGIFFLVGVIIDLRTKKVPSILFTSMIFVALFMAGFTRGLEAGYFSILFGLIAGVFGLLLWEMYFIGGLADVKALILMGLLCVDFANFIVMIFLVAVLGTLYQAGFKFYKYQMGLMETGEGDSVWKAMFLEKNEDPFLLLLFLVYIVMIWIGGVI